LIQVQHGISFISKEANCEIMDYERSKNEDCGGWKSECGLPERGDLAAPEYFSDVAFQTILFNASCGAIPWSRTFGERTATGAAHGAEAMEHVDRSPVLECRDAQQHVDAIPLPELQQQQQLCIKADSLSLCCFIRSGAK
jgi:hypothetical protein